MRVEREMDSGAIALQREIEIGEHENAGDLSERLAKLTADTLEEVIEQIAEDRVSWVPQDDTRVTFAPKIRRSDAELIWTESAEALCRRVRAMAPSPGAFATSDGWLLPRILQRPGKRALDVEAFMRGKPIPDGIRLG